jgi:hypothetical protein
VHYLSSPCTLSPLVVHSLSRLCTSIHPLRLLSAFIPSVHHVHLDPSIALLYLLRYSTADPLNSLSTFRANPHRPSRTLRPTDRNILDRSTGYSSFSASSYPLFILGSSWEEVLCFSYSSPSLPRCCVHGVWIMWRCIVIPWSYPNRRWVWSCSEPLCSILHMCEELLLFNGCVSPIFIILWFGSLHNVGVHSIG